jgi:class 3 adenylate cyclase
VTPLYIVALLFTFLAGLPSSRLWDQGLTASVGVTTGVVFCGVVGATMRKEYTVLGDTVNLSARLMQYACANGGGVVCDQQVSVLPLACT